MLITDFDYGHIERALKLAGMNYEEERLVVPFLPQVEILPDLKHFAENRLGVAAYEDDTMIGFLCTYAPVRDAFGTTNTRGTFSPIHAHGVITEYEFRKRGCPGSYNRDRIYSRMYQAAAEKWVREGIRSHAVGLYAHDKAAENSFFYNGFGLRCIDAVRSLEDILHPVDTSQMIKTDVEYLEVPREEYGLLLEEHNALIVHLGNSPCFMKFKPLDTEELYRRAPESVRYFAAKAEGRYIAYIKTDKQGENFATTVGGMENICGAYCRPEYRGSGVYHNLLGFLINVLRKEGFRLLGVDCESFNPTARGFWLKYFTEYTHSVVRRVDETAFTL
jgi:GNAT superfamily N-acetyltransferase